MYTDTFPKIAVRKRKFYLRNALLSLGNLFVFEVSKDKETLSRIVGNSEDVTL